MSNNSFAYELIEGGYNIHSKEQNSNNNTQRIISDISNNEFNTTFKKWEFSSNMCVGEKKTVIELNIWQECFVKKLKKLKETKKIVFKNEGNYTDIKIIVEEASARLTFEYSKIINEFMEENPKIKIIFCVLSLKTYIENDSEVVVECE